MRRLLITLIASACLVHLVTTFVDAFAYTSATFGTGVGFTDPLHGSAVVIRESAGSTSGVLANFEGTRQAIATAFPNLFKLGVLVEDSQDNSFGPGAVAEAVSGFTVAGLPSGSLMSGVSFTLSGTGLVPAAALAHAGAQVTLTVHDFFGHPLGFAAISFSSNLGGSLNLQVQTCSDPLTQTWDDCPVTLTKTPYELGTQLSVSLTLPLGLPVIAGNGIVAQMTGSAHGAGSRINYLGSATLDASVPPGVILSLATGQTFGESTGVNQAPLADAGSPQTVQEGMAVRLEGGLSFDPDGETLTFSWTQEDGPPVTLSGPSSATPGFTAPLLGPAGDTLTFRLVVTDTFGLSAEDTVEVTVTNVNQQPVAFAGADHTRNEGTLVTLDGTLSADPDGDALTYQWTQLSGPSVTLTGVATATPSFTAPAVGETTPLQFQLVVSDGQLTSEPDVATVTVLNINQPVACGAAVASPNFLWPPNHKLVPVGITGVTDPDSDPVAIVITRVTQDERVAGPWQHGPRPDAVIRGNTVLLRAERSARNGRVYEVHFRADDGRGGTCNGSVLVGVPHSMKPGQPIVDDGQAYDSTREPRRHHGHEHHGRNGRGNDGHGDGSRHAKESRDR